MLESADPGPVWVVLPTYDERDNLEPVVRAVRAQLAGAAPDHTILVVDDSSPDGTGELADRLALDDSHVKVLHRPRKEGLGQAYLAGFEVALLGRSGVDPGDGRRFLSRPVVPATDDRGRGDADLVLGSRYVAGGGTRNWGRLRSFVSRGGCWYARTVLGLPIRDLTGGFKCFRREVLEALDLSQVRSQGYAFQVELTYRALQLGFRVREIPIVFTDRRVGQSKMSRRIVLEAMWMIPTLRRQPVPTGKASSNEVSRV